MRHKVAGHKLGRDKDEREALRRIMIKQLFEHERIETTRAKAESLRGAAERLITLAKKSSDGSDAQKVHARRLAAAKMGDNKMIQKLFDDIAPRFTDRNGGYTRMYKLGPRLGDAAEMVILELVEE